MKVTTLCAATPQPWDSFIGPAVFSGGQPDPLAAETAETGMASGSAPLILDFSISERVDCPCRSKVVLRGFQHGGLACLATQFMFVVNVL
jgi:hypothetical protein